MVRLQNGVTEERKLFLRHLCKRRTVACIMTGEAQWINVYVDVCKYLWRVGSLQLWLVLSVGKEIPSAGYFPDRHCFKIWFWLHAIRNDNKTVISYSNCELKIIPLMGILIFNDVKFVLGKNFSHLCTVPLAINLCVCYIYFKSCEFGQTPAMLT